MPSWIRTTASAFTLEIDVRPGSRRRAIVQADSQRLVIALRSPHEKGAANDELIAFVAQLARTPRSAIKIMRGTASRHKVVWIATPDSSTTARRVVQGLAFQSS